MSCESWDSAPYEEFSIVLVPPGKVVADLDEAIAALKRKYQPGMDEQKRIAEEERRDLEDHTYKDMCEKINEARVVRGLPPNDLCANLLANSSASRDLTRL